MISHNQNIQNGWQGNNTQQQYENLSGIAIVHNDNEVMNYPVGPGSTVLLINFGANEFYLKTVDMYRNMLPIKVFAFEEVIQQPPQQENQQFVSRDEFNAMSAQLLNLQNMIIETNKMLDDLTAPNK